MASEAKIEDDDMTPEERELQLRDRGVLIENPSNTASQTISPGITNILEQMTGSVGSNNGISTISFVCIPHDESKPIFNLGLPTALAETIGGDCLPDYVKPYFAADKSSIDATLLKEQATKHFAGGNLAGLADTNISTAAMNAAAAQGSTETFPLVHPAESNGYQGMLED